MESTPMRKVIIIIITKLTDLHIHCACEICIYKLLKCNIFILLLTHSHFSYCCEMMTLIQWVFYDLYFYSLSSHLYLSSIPPLWCGFDARYDVCIISYGKESNSSRRKTKYWAFFRTRQWWRRSGVRPVVDPPLQNSCLTGVHLHCSM